MSFILDAIAKSEQERQQQEAPKAQILALPTGNQQQPHRRLLPYLIIGALLVNAAVLAIWMQSDDLFWSFQKEQGIPEDKLTSTDRPPADEAVSNIAITDARKSTGPTIDKALSSQAIQFKSTASLNKPLVEQQPATLDAASDAAGTTAIGSQKLPSETTITPTDEDTSGWLRIEPSTLSSRAGLETGNGTQNIADAESTPDKISHLYDLPDTVRNDLPTVKFSGHLYSSNPDSSFVFVDNERPVMQGQQIVDELLLHEITPTGVIVKFRGYLIEVGVLQNWTLN